MGGFSEVVGGFKSASNVLNYPPRIYVIIVSLSKKIARNQKIARNVIQNYDYVIIVKRRKYKTPPYVILSQKRISFFFPQFFY